MPVEKSTEIAATRLNTLWAAQPLVFHWRFLQDQCLKMFAEGQPVSSVKQFKAPWDSLDKVVIVAGSFHFQILKPFVTYDKLRCFLGPLAS